MNQQQPPTRKRESGFTLIELIVVIAIIVMLAAIIVPIATTLGGGKSLRLTGNAVDAYISNLRSEALKSGNEIIVVCFPREFDSDDEPVTREITVSFADGSSGAARIEVGSGFVAFEKRKRSDFPKGEEPEAHQIYRYMGKDFNFDEDLDSDVLLHRDKVSEWKNNISAIDKIEGQNLSDMRSVGIIPEGNNQGYFFFIIHRDGRVEIPNDVAVTEIDLDDRGRDGDLVFQDGKSVLFIDISRYAKVTSRIYSEEGSADSDYQPIDED